MISTLCLPSSNVSPSLCSLLSLFVSLYGESLLFLIYFCYVFFLLHFYDILVLLCPYLYLYIYLSLCFTFSVYILLCLCLSFISLSFSLSFYDYLL